VKTNRIRVLSCLAILLVSVSTIVTSACSSSPKTSPTTAKATTVAPTTTQTSLPPPTKATSAQPSTSVAPATTSFPYQGSGSGNWAGQLTMNNRTISVSGTMSVAVDANGVFSGTISDSSGSAAPTAITAKVESNGNLAGTVSFTIQSITFVTTWQGKMTASGSTLRMDGTWTSQYGSGTFSGSGTSSK
jgi:hypothetical protein